jgi:hypothetical protein
MIELAGSGRCDGVALHAYIVAPAALGLRHLKRAAPLKHAARGHLAHTPQARLPAIARPAAHRA